MAPAKLEYQKSKTFLVSNSSACVERLKDSTETCLQLSFGPVHAWAGRRAKHSEGALALPIPLVSLRASAYHAVGAGAQPLNTLAR